MRECHYCQLFQPSWNQLHEDFQKWYGDEQIEFLVVEGPLQPYICDLYEVEAYPTFILVKNNFEDREVFTGNYDYTSLKNWLVNNLQS